MHAQSVALVLSLTTGLVTPQFHMAFEDHFETVQDAGDYTSNWMSKTHFGNAPMAHKTKRLLKQCVKGVLVTAPRETPEPGTVEEDQQVDLQDTENSREELADRSEATDILPPEEEDDPPGHMTETTPQQPAEPNVHWSLTGKGDEVQKKDGVARDL